MSINCVDANGSQIELLKLKSLADVPLVLLEATVYELEI
jgi:hypothetical protein